MLPYSISPATTALLVVDLQKGYCSPDSDAACGVLKWDVRPMEELCQRTVPFVEKVREVLPAAHIIWARMEEHEGTMAKSLHMSSDQDFVRLCVRGTPGFDYHIVEPKADETELFKTHYSAFHVGARAHTIGQNNKLVVSGMHKGRHYSRPKNLHGVLQMLGITTVATCGVLASRCVHGSEIGGTIFDYRVIHLSDYVAVPAGKVFAREAKEHGLTRDLLYTPSITGAQFLAELKK